MIFNRPTKCMVYFSSHIMTSIRVRGELQSKGLSGVPGSSTKKHTKTTNKVAIVIVILEHYKAYHMTIFICKTCYMIVQMIKIKLAEFFGLCN